MDQYHSTIINIITNILCTDYILIKNNYYCESDQNNCTYDT